MAGDERTHEHRQGLVDAMPWMYGRLATLWIFHQIGYILFEAVYAPKGATFGQGITWGPVYLAISFAGLFGAMPLLIWWRTSFRAHHAINLQEFPTTEMTKA